MLHPELARHVTILSVISHDESEAGLRIGQSLVSQAVALAAHEKRCAEIRVVSDSLLPFHTRLGKPGLLQSPWGQEEFRHQKPRELRHARRVVENVGSLLIEYPPQRIEVQRRIEFSPG